MRGPLRHRPFALLIVGQLVSNLGDAIYAVALPWFILAHHGGTLLLGEVLTAYGVPRAALLLLGGHATDRLRPWLIMLVANLVRGVAVVGFALAAAAGDRPGPLVFVIAVVLGAGEGIFIPASSVVVVSLVGPDELQAGNALSFGTTQLAQLAGPALGGLLVALTRPAAGFAIDAATFAVSAATLVGIQRRPPPSAGPSTADVPADAGASVWTVFVREPICRVILITDALLNLGSAGMGRVALPALARGPLHVGAGGYGILSAAMGAGLLLGTIAGARLPPLRHPLLVSSLALLPTVALLATVPYLGGLFPAAAALVAMFALISISNLLLITGEQRWAPPHLLGRITALLMLASVGMLPVSVLVAGIVVHLVGPTLYFPLDAGTILIAALAQLRSPSWRGFAPSPSPARATGAREG